MDFRSNSWICFYFGLLPSGMGREKFGGGKKSSIGVFIGLFIGLFFPPMGIIIGPFVGAFLGAIYEIRNDNMRALKVAFGSLLGLFLVHS